ncbi:hypothetical protein F0A17_20360 [Billgrantia pellis]|uniref:Uncharacterized protein n=2 Tax=Billgrantia pellis TaxID=2606936 RepID=A0A7V7KF94_9GAMM|nr:hypothetical protein [Halomonas pellis]KAA0009662.1 hypothetical protein F0A17_20360 [Halomonas pellis]
MPMLDPNDPRRNAAWQAAQQWRARTRQTPGGPLGGLKLIFTWLLFGLLLIVGTLLGLFFLLIGWAMLPFVRHRMKKRLEQMRAEQARDAGSGYYYREETVYRDGRRHSEHELLEGDYQVRDDERGR